MCVTGKVNNKTLSLEKNNDLVKPMVVTMVDKMKKTENSKIMTLMGINGTSAKILNNFETIKITVKITVIKIKYPTV